MVIFDDNEAEAEVFKVSQAMNGDNVYHVKVSFPVNEVYFNKVKVRRSLRNKDEWWVQLFSYKPRGRWIFPTEMSNESPLFKVIQETAIKAVEEFREIHGGDNQKLDVEDV